MHLEMIDHVQLDPFGNRLEFLEPHSGRSPA
jgi:hypothetical protein